MYVGVNDGIWVGFVLYVVGIFEGDVVRVLDSLFVGAVVIGFHVFKVIFDNVVDGYFANNFDHINNDMSYIIFNRYSNHLVSVLLILFR